MSPERGGHTPRVGGRCESDPPGPDPEGTSLRTARLRLLPLTSRDESDHARASRNAADALRDTRAADVQWREHGFGPWAVRDKQGSCFLGCAELRLAGDGIEGIAPDEVEAGWWVTEERRNDGIATEAMEAAIDISSAAPTSRRSRRTSRTGETKHPAAWQPSSDSRYAAEATGARASR